MLSSSPSHAVSCFRVERVGGWSEGRSGSRRMMYRTLGSLLFGMSVFSLSFVRNSIYVSCVRRLN